MYTSTYNKLFNVLGIACKKSMISLSGLLNNVLETIKY